MLRRFLGVYTPRIGTGWTSKPSDAFSYTLPDTSGVLRPWSLCAMPYSVDSSGARADLRTKDLPGEVLQFTHLLELLRLLAPGRVARGPARAPRNLAALRELPTLPR